jgi:hypothetical protein
MPKGGRRPGAGRPKGTKGRKAVSAAIVKKAVSEGKPLPLDVLLFSMDHYYGVAIAVEGLIDEAALKEATLLAQAAAPYCHPRLNAVQQQTETTVTYVARLPSPVTDIEEWKKTVQALLPAPQ